MLTGQVATLYRFYESRTNVIISLKQFDVLMILNGLESLKRSLQQPSVFTRPCPSDVLFLYLAVLVHAISEVLVKKNLNVQKLIYCVI